MRYAEHPDIEIPILLQVKPWKDASWCNDALPCSELHMPCGALFRVWVGYDEGKAPYDLAEPTHKYAVEFYANEDDTDTYELVYIGDDLTCAMYAVNLKRMLYIQQLILSAYILLRDK